MQVICLMRGPPRDRHAIGTFATSATLIARAGNFGGQVAALERSQPAAPNLTLGLPSGPPRTLSSPLGRAPAALIPPASDAASRLAIAG